MRDQSTYLEGSFAIRASRKGRRDVDHSVDALQGFRELIRADIRDSDDLEVRVSCVGCLEGISFGSAGGTRQRGRLDRLAWT